MHDSELDHYEEQEKEWRAKEDVKVDITEEIKKAMKELQCIPDIFGLSYEDLYIHQISSDLVMRTCISIKIFIFQKGSRSQSLTPSEEWATIWLI